LGKYHLHLGWLFREIDELGVRDEVYARIHYLKSKAEDYWPEIPVTEKSALSYSIKYYEIAVYESTTDLMRKTEHKVFQLLGRINMKEGEYAKARILFHEGLKCVYRLKIELEHSLKAAKGARYEQLLDDVMPKLHTINAFYIETKDLLQDCKELAQKGSHEN